MLVPGVLVPVVGVVVGGGGVAGEGGGPQLPHHVQVLPGHDSGGRTHHVCRENEDIRASTEGSRIFYNHREGPSGVIVFTFWKALVGTLNETRRQ